MRLIHCADSLSCCSIFRLLGSAIVSPLPSSAGCQSLCDWLHQQNIQWFGSHNWTTQQLWTTRQILPAAPRCTQKGWVQSDVLSGAPRLRHLCSCILRKLWNRIQEHSEECSVVFQMLQNETIKMCKFWSYWECWPHPQRCSGAPWTWIHTLSEWVTQCSYYSV